MEQQQEKIIFHKGQANIVLDNHRFRVVICGRKFGKTLLSVYELIGMAVAKNDRIIAYMATTYGEARDIAWKRLLKIAGPAIVGKPNETRLEITLRTQEGGTSIISLRGWESVETMRGMEFDFIVLDEIQNYKDFWAYWQEVLRPALTPRKGSALFIGTPKGFNHVYDLYNLGLQDPDFKSFHFTSYDNTHLDPKEIDIAKTQMTPERFAQEYMAEFTKTEGLVFKQFNREKHLYDKMPDGVYEYIAGVDFGYTNPAGVAHIYTNGEKYWIDDEWYKTQRTELQIAEYVNGCKFQAVYPDPENPSAIENMRQLGINVREVSKGKDSIKSGVQKMQELFIQGKLMINRKCINLISELESYTFEEENTEKNNSEKPIQLKNHLIDATRYAIFMTYDITPPTGQDKQQVYETRQEGRKASEEW